MEETFVMIKPDGLKKHVVKHVFEVFLENGLTISDAHLVRLDKEFLNEHYAHLVGKDFYPHLVDFMLSGNIFAMKITGENAVLKVRDLIGSTDPKKARPGTIRALYGSFEDVAYNVIHASDSVENAKIELERIDNYTKKLMK